MQENKIVVTAKSNLKVFLNILFESLVSLFIIILALFVLRNEDFVSHLSSYFLLSLVIFFFTLLVLCITYLFRTNFARIEANEEELILYHRRSKKSQNIPFTDIDKIIKTRDKRNACTKIILKNGKKISVWNNGFHSDEWKKWTSLLETKGFISSQLSAQNPAK